MEPRPGLSSGYGGPVWHVSVAPRVPYVGRVMCEGRALETLLGLGAAHAGEWREWTGSAFHIRRRLTKAEARGLELRDIRRTVEAHRRLAAMPVHIIAKIPQWALAQEV